MTIFVGNTFPLTLVRRKVEIRPIEKWEVSDILCDEMGEYVSFWGHENTLKIASDYAGIDLTPPCERPALSLNKDNLPFFDGKYTYVVLVLSPEYQQGFRPAIGAEVPPEMVLGWQWLEVRFIP